MDNNTGVPVTVVSGLDRPHGLAFLNSKFYVAESGAIDVFDYSQSSLSATNKKKIIDLPAGGVHFTRTIGFGPDGRIYVSIGSDCNVCVEKDPRRAAIWVANTDGSDFKRYATGLRNAVFFTWHPDTHLMWATVMGRDYLGDDLPPDTVDIIDDGKFYGWPYCYGKKIWDKTYNSDPKYQTLCGTSESSFLDLPAHSAPLGLVFVPSGSNWPKEYRGNLLVAYHGSWNRSAPTGYKIVRFPFPKIDLSTRPVEQEDFISGWLTAGGALGRPVDLLFDTKGNLFVSDDKAGVIYRVSYNQ